MIDGLAFKQVIEPALNLLKCVFHVGIIGRAPFDWPSSGKERAVVHLNGIITNAGLAESQPLGVKNFLAHDEPRTPASQRWTCDVAPE